MIKSCWLGEWVAFLHAEVHGNSRNASCSRPRLHRQGSPLVGALYMGICRGEQGEKIIPPGFSHNTNIYQNTIANIFKFIKFA